MDEASRTSARTHLCAHARALERLAPRYGWSHEDLVWIQALLEVHPDLLERYWRNLAIARAAGFVQTKQNGFQTLPVWCAQTGRPDPGLHELKK